MAQPLVAAEKAAASAIAEGVPVAALWSGYSKQRDLGCFNTKAETGMLPCTHFLFSAVCGN